MRDEPTIFGSLLRRHRRSAGLTQEALAERAGISARTVSDIERGLRRGVYRDTAERLSEALALSDAARTEFEATARGGSRVAIRAAEAPGALATAVPAPPIRLLGREEELSTVRSLLLDGDVRLVTLTGPGGIGKTTLGLAVGRALRERFSENVFVLSLGDVRDPALVPAIVAGSLAGSGAGPPLEAIAARLEDDSALLVLDTFEHLLRAGPWVGELLAACPGLSVLATSRERLHLRGEREVALQPLRLPPAGGDRIDLRLHPATALFLERAAEAGAEPDLDDVAAADVEEICRRLEGLPLAIELAAARLRHLTVRALRERLVTGLDVLTGGPRDLPPRQRTIRDTVAWSYDLLAPSEQALFRRLSVFAGGWTLDAAELVCGRDTDVLSDLSGLVDKSLVTLARTPDDRPRYAMFDVVREYAVERAEAEERVPDLERRHLECFLSMVERAEPEVVGRGQGTWLPRLSADAPNLRAAMRRAIDLGDADLSLRLTAALWQSWMARGQFAEGRAWLREALALEGSSPARNRGLWGAALLAYHQGDYDETERLGGELAAAAGEDPIEARNAATVQGFVALARSRDDEGLRLFARSVELCRPLGTSWHLATSLLNLGLANLQVGLLEPATALFGEARAMFERVGDAHFAAKTTGYVGLAEVLAGNVAGARDLLAESLRRYRDLEDRVGIAEGLEGLAAVAAVAGAPERAARLAGAAQRVREPFGSRPLPFDAARLERQLSSARAASGPARWDAAWAAGRAMDADEAVAVALEPLD